MRRERILALKDHGRDPTLKGRNDGRGCIFHPRLWRPAGPPWRAAVTPRAEAL